MRSMPRTEKRKLAARDMALGVAIRIDGADGVNPNIIHKIPLYGPTWDPIAMS